MPAAPLVGAVTTRPPAAFSSLTASANRLTQSSTISGSAWAASGLAVSAACKAGARRRTLKPPGSTPAVAQPRTTHACIVCQMRSSPASVAASSRQWRSLRRITSAMVHRSSSVSASSCAPVWKGWGSTVVSGATLLWRVPSAATSSLTTKPPPTE